MVKSHDFGMVAIVGNLFNIKEKRVRTTESLSDTEYTNTCTNLTDLHAEASEGSDVNWKMDWEEVTENYIAIVERRKALPLGD